MGGCYSIAISGGSGEEEQSPSERKSPSDEEAREIWQRLDLAGSKQNCHLDPATRPADLRPLRAVSSRIGGKKIPHQIPGRLSHSQWATGLPGGHLKLEVWSEMIASVQTGNPDDRE